MEESVVELLPSPRPKINKRKGYNYKKYFLLILLMFSFTTVMLSNFDDGAKIKGEP